MRRFRLNLVLLMAGVVVMTAGASVAFAAGEWRWGVPAAVAAVCCGGGVFVMVRKLTGVMSMFVSAMEMNDTTMRFDVGGDDPQLGRMSESMNRIMELYRANNVEMETRKLFYDRILSVMTHEMRNGITPVVALTDDMLAHPDKYSGESLTDALSLISEQSSGIKHFLDSYARLTHLPAPRLERVQVAEFIAGVCDVMSLELGERGLGPEAVTYTVGTDMTVEMDRDLMRQAVVNLLRNALDAASAPGIVTRVELRVVSVNGTPCMYVTDNGPGIERGVMENLFQPFYTTKPGGSGIGLYLSRQIARLHGGDLRLSSVAGHGTTAMLSLSPSLN